MQKFFRKIRRNPMMKEISKIRKILLKTQFSWRILRIIWAISIRHPHLPLETSFGTGPDSIAYYFILLYFFNRLSCYILMIICDKIIIYYFFLCVLIYNLSFPKNN